MTTSRGLSSKGGACGSARTPPDAVSAPPGISPRWAACARRARRCSSCATWLRDARHQEPEPQDEAAAWRPRLVRVGRHHGTSRIPATRSRPRTASRPAPDTAPRTPIDGQKRLTFWQHHSVHELPASSAPTTNQQPAWIVATPARPRWRDIYCPIRGDIACVPSSPLIDVSRRLRDAEYLRRETGIFTGFRQDGHAHPAYGCQFALMGRLRLADAPPAFTPKGLQGSRGPQGGPSSSRSTLYGNDTVSSICGMGDEKVYATYAAVRLTTGTILYAGPDAAQHGPQ